MNKSEDEDLLGKSAAPLPGLCNGTFLHILELSAFSTKNKLDAVEVAQDDILTKALRDTKSLVMSKVQVKRRLIGVMAPDSWEWRSF